MREYGFSLTSMLLYKDRIVDFVVMRLRFCRYVAKIQSLCERIQVSVKNPLFRIFYAVTCLNSLTLGVHKKVMHT